MSGEKQKMSESIVDSIISEVEATTLKMENEYQNTVQKEIDDYRSQVELSINQKIETIRKREEKKRSTQESELRFSVSQKLRQHRLELYNKFEMDMKNNILKFLESDGYKVYLNDVVKSIQEQGIDQEGVFKFREQDFKLLKNDQVSCISQDLELGGIIFETKTKVYDYSLLTRFNNAMETFVKESQLWI